MKFDLKNTEKVDRFLNSVFIYPTDTVYGIGCDAEDEKLVEKIREIKKRDAKPFSVIAPSKKWILENCEVDESLIDKYLPGAYTLILKKKKKDFLSSVSDTEFLGVRIPDCDFTKVLQKTGKPIVTTSVNFSGENPANKINEIDSEILDKVDFVVDVGELSGTPSTIVKDGKEIKR
jgi:L-threonylcarbamoyladenylate synthase